MSKHAVPSLTAQCRNTKAKRIKVVSDTYGLEIVLKIGDTMTSDGIVKKTDILTQSESRNRPKSVRLEELVDAGFVTYVEEERHPHQVKHLNLTEDGWKIWTAFSEIRNVTVKKKKLRIWSDSEQGYIEVD